MKKGFTLVELLATIAILSLIAAIAYPIVTGMMRDMRRSADESQKKIIIDASRYWVSDHDDLLSDNEGDIYVLYITALKEGGYLTNTELKDIENDKTLLNSCVKITTDVNKYSYEYQKNCQ